MTEKSWMENEVGEEVYYMKCDLGNGVMVEDWRFKNEIKIRRTSHNGSVIEEYSYKNRHITGRKYEKLAIKHKGLPMPIAVDGKVNDEIVLQLNQLKRLEDAE